MPPGGSETTPTEKLVDLKNEVDNALLESQEASTIAYGYATNAQNYYDTVKDDASINLETKNAASEYNSQIYILSENIKSQIITLNTYVTYFTDKVNRDGQNNSDATADDIETKNDALTVKDNAIKYKNDAYNKLNNLKILLGITE